MVDNLIKPAWLCDFIFPSDIQMNKLLRDLTRKGYLCEKLHAIVISSDILVVHLKLFLEKINIMIKSLEEDVYTDFNTIFVTLKDSSVSTRINEKTKANLKKALQLIACGILNYQKTSEEKYLTFDIGDITPTIFGIALGYPIIYIQENAKDTAPDTLDLQMIEAQLSIDDFPCYYCKSAKQLNSTILYSFSIPTGMKTLCLQVLNHWKKKLTEQCNISNIQNIIIERNLKNVHVIL